MPIWYWNAPENDLYYAFHFHIRKVPLPYQAVFLIFLKVLICALSHFMYQMKYFMPP